VQDSPGDEEPGGLQGRARRRERSTHSARVPKRERPVEHDAEGATEAAKQTALSEAAALARGNELRPRHQSQWTPLARALSATGDHWTLSIVLQLAQDSRRRVQLQRQLKGISSGVLDRHLQQMVALGLLSRRRFKEMPPRVELQLTAAGRELLPIAGALASWGMRHMWSAPETREQVSVEALLNLLPALLKDAKGLPDGTLELAVQDAGQLATSQLFGIKQGHLRALDKGIVMKPAASVVGNTNAWIAALGPARDYRKLRLSGRKGLARSVLEALPRTLAQLSD
jgi:DNA-binding HxlR family transcriptional regulator